jgi:hypothetical protein
MSVEENGSRVESSREDHTGTSTFDSAARGLADGSVSRGKALRMLAASLFGGALVAAPAAVAVAAPKPGAGGSKGCPTGQVRVNGQCQCPTDPCPVSGQTRNAQCQCECPGGQQVVNGACVPGCTGGGQVLCEGQCVQACSGGQELNAACQCVCPTTACSVTGQTRNEQTCQCECPAGQQVFEGACVPGCTGSGTVLCTPSGSNTPQCVQACSGGRELNAACECGCPTGTALCGTGSNARCVDNTCGTGSTFNTTTCRCEANACGATNCEGCCGTNNAGDPICRAGTTTTNCGSNGVTCATCNTGQNCGTTQTGATGCCKPSNATCATTAECCTGLQCRLQGGSLRCRS